MKKLFLILFLLTGCTQGSKLSGAGATLPGSSSSGGGGGGAITEPAGTSNVQLTWSANPGEQQGFKILMSTDNVNFTQNQIVPNGTNSATVPGLTPGTYYFQILGYNQAGNSPVSPTLTAVVP
jgi:hypothetical protein